MLAAARESTKSRRSRLVNALGHVSLGEPEVLAFLTEALRSRDVYHGCAGWWDVPAAAAEALGRIGPPARETVPALLDAFRGDMRDEAAAALRAITGEDPVLTALPADRDE